MIARAIIEEVIDKYNMRVRIPIYHSVKGAASATPTNELPIAAICQQPNRNTVYEAGDLVFVAFENNQRALPIILGKVYNSKCDESLIDSQLVYKYQIDNELLKNI